jgi:ribosomal RNA-processing protein 8
LTQYHTGFRHQVQSWPTNPVSHYISALSTYSSKTIIADLGCGDAALARALVPKGMTVLSFDLVSDGAYVVEADVCMKLPLPGSEGPEGEKSEGEGHMVDVVVCALSLMGTNWPNCIRETWRILKSGYVYYSSLTGRISPFSFDSGELKIAEVASRFTDPEEFTSLIISIGFKLKSKVRLPWQYSSIRFSPKSLYRMKAILISLYLSSKRWRGKRRTRRNGRSWR